jgi:transcriptional regulator with XRE-family HTH domain
VRVPPLGFAALLRRHRSTAGLSQEELARRAGLSADTIAALERGRRRAPRPLTVRLLADALGLQGETRASFVEAARQHSAVERPPAPPVPLGADEFIGRGGELAEATRLLTDSRARMVTLTGPGGIGKTRLAIELTAAVSARFPDGVHWASLGQSATRATVIAAVATSLGRNQPADDAPLDLLADHIGDRRMLLVLDNCEHVIDTAAMLCSTLLRRCPQPAYPTTSG